LAKFAVLLNFVLKSVYQNIHKGKTVECTEFYVSKDVNTEAEEATALEAVTRRQPVKTQQTVL
jgi:hypothetical protein